eukprot:CAMPEP_0196812554 /NCGR_PEP_ID=MMETSP1362-20130617/28049_1 /TAXON_ID=163516 /ORGANISM="Leptocylindrus danicus, Strain CCMP1856" /LENGTH=30 /DNA_ID= /DNA_START= /DNA_END= /DNA_ORIENTATION=
MTHPAVPIGAMVVHFSLSKHNRYTVFTAAR